MKRTANILRVLAAVLAILFLSRMELKVGGEFKVLPAQNADVQAAIEGIIQEVYVDEGDLVSEGDVLARLSDRDYRAELRKVEAEIDEKRAKLKMLKLGPRRKEINRAQKEVETAKTRAVTTMIDNACLFLKPEMTGNAKVFCGNRRIVDLIAWRFARYIRVGFWSWW